MRISDWSSDVCSSDTRRHRPADAVDVGQGNLDPLLRRNIDASNTCHFANSLNAADPGPVRPENHVWTSRIVRSPEAPEAVDYRNRKQCVNRHATPPASARSAEHTSELQSLK